MVYHLIHEIAVVAHHDYAAWEILQIFFQYLQSLNVKVVGWLIEHKEVWILHQHRTQIQLSSFATAELIHIVLLLLRCEHEILQKLCCRHVSARPKVDVFRNIFYHIDNLLLVVKLQSLLREISKPHGVTDVESSTIRSHLSKQHFYKSRLSRTVVAYDTHLLKSCEVVIEILQYHHLVVAIVE